MAKMTKDKADKAYEALMDVIHDIGSDKDMKKAVASIKFIARSDAKKSDKIIKHLIGIALYGLNKIDEDIENEEAAEAAK